jgi:predicted HTH transcriptional regulator
MSITHLSSRTDPPTSALAAADHDRTGRRETNRQRMLQAVRDCPSCTSDELGEHAEISRHEAARRLADLLHDGLVEQGPQRRSSICGRLCVTWQLPTPQPIKQGVLF